MDPQFLDFPNQTDSPSYLAGWCPFPFNFTVHAFIHDCLFQIGLVSFLLDLIVKVIQVKLGLGVEDGSTLKGFLQLGVV